MSQQEIEYYLQKLSDLAECVELLGTETSSLTQDEISQQMRTFIAEISRCCTKQSNIFEYQI